ncbi:hypothetical protein ABIE65_001740 [Constrictibacter sp. MBR-5]|jgi:hypothetical protein|uniref:FecR domain-containing protein n=1 Tax=Constrictibacter sp. MBR-5 TaxID=3156467 RepID=UPI0033991FEC
MRPYHWLTVASVIAAALAVAPQAADAARVGTTAAVNPEATGTPPGGATRTLFIGQDIVFEEKIVTAGAGQTQILFLDQSALTVGPNSEVVIDRFVYDPDRSTGEMVVSVTKGLFRFVGGKISSTSGATIRTPTATLGIRGSVVLGASDPLDIVFVAGSTLNVSNASGNLNMDSRSIGRRVVTNGGAPQDGGSASAATLRSYLAALNTPGSGSAPEQPTDVGARAGLGNRLPGGSILHFAAANYATGGSTSNLQPGTAGGASQIRDVVETGANTQVRDAVTGGGSHSPGGGLGGIFGGLPSAPGGSPGTRTTDTIEGYGTSLRFTYDGTGDPIALLSNSTDLEGVIVAAGSPTPTLTIERSVEGDHIDADLRLDRLYEFGKGRSVNSLFFDDDTFAAIISPNGPGGTPGGPVTVMVTHDLLQAPQGVDETKLCSCSFLTWGYWAADVPGASSSETPGQRDLVALGTWVAGKLPTAADIPTTGTASYAGHAVGSVVDNGQFRMATGSMTANFDFGTRSGSMHINDFDNRDYTGSASAVTNRMSINVISSDGNVSGNVVGSFARNGSDPVGGVIGDLILSGTNGSGGSYVGVGTIAGQKATGQN